LLRLAQFGVVPLVRCVPVAEHRRKREQTADESAVFSDPGWQNPSKCPRNDTVSLTCIKYHKKGKKSIILMLQLLWTKHAAACNNLVVRRHPRKERHGNR
jgi:hypothetical protein